MVGHRLAFQLVIALSLCVAWAQDDDLNELISSRERVVRAARDRLETAINGEFTCDDLATCADDCTVNLCASNVLSPQYVDAACTLIYGGKSFCETDGIMLAPGESGVRLTRTFDTSEEQRTLITEDICFSKVVDPVFVENLRNTPGLMWQYTGYQSGVHRSFPARPWSQPRDGATCNLYDPRRRPWYVATASGPKNIVLVIDQSASMSGGIFGTDEIVIKRMDMAKIAARDVVSTLNEADYFAVVGFSANSSAATENVAVNSEAPGLPQLLRALSENVNSAVAAIDDMSWVNGAGGHYNRGLERAMDILAASEAAGEGHTSGCTSVIILLSDDDPSTGSEGDTSKLLQERWPEFENSTMVMSYRLGQYPVPRNSLLRKVACHTGGLTVDVPFSGAVSEVEKSLREAMTSYYTVLAAVQDRSSNVTWSAPYLDANGLGVVVSAALPVYYRGGDGLPILIGVTSIDLTGNQMLEATENRTLDSLAARLASAGTFKCTAVKPQPCQMQELRIRPQAVNTESVADAVCDPTARDDDGNLIDFFDFSQLPPTLDECLMERTIDPRPICSVQETNVSALCPGEPNTRLSLSCCPKRRFQMPGWAVALIVIGSVLLLVLVARLCYIRRRRLEQERLRARMAAWQSDWLAEMDRAEAEVEREAAGTAVDVASR